MSAQNIKPKVSILCLAFNQESFIDKCLEGMLIQKTNFNFEILIHDDASTDTTAKIIKRYEKKFPSIIKPIYQKKNQYSQGVKITPTFQLPRVNGDYIALCEGDDYWTDETKLQQQVDFMEKNPDYAVCFHKVNIVYENKEQPDRTYPDVKDKRWYTRKELFYTNYIQTNSVMYRKQTYDNMPTDSIPGDWFLHLYHARFGKIKFIDKTMSVYRKHTQGMWWDYDVDRDAIWRKHGVGHLAMWVNLADLYKGKPAYMNIIWGHIIEMINTIINLDVKYGDNNLRMALEAYPSAVYGALQKQSEIHQKLAELTSQLTQKEREMSSLIGQLDTKEQELLHIKSTKTWKLRGALQESIKKTGVDKISRAVDYNG